MSTTKHTAEPCFVCGHHGATGSDTHDRSLHRAGDVIPNLQLVPNYANASAAVMARGEVVAEFFGCRVVAEENAKRFIACAGMEDPAEALRKAREALALAISYTEKGRSTVRGIYQEALRALGG